MYLVRITVKYKSPAGVYLGNKTITGVFQPREREQKITKAKIIKQTKDFLYDKLKEANSDTEFEFGDAEVLKNKLMFSLTQTI